MTWAVKPMPRSFQFGRDGAGIGLAGLDPVGHEDHGRCVLGIPEGLGGRDDGVGHRRAPARVDRVHRLDDGGARVGPGLDQHLDIRAIPPPVVPVGHQPEIEGAGQVLQHLRDHLARDDDLVDAIDLPPHRPRRIENEDRIGTFVHLCGCRESKKKAGHEQGSDAVH
jgi:hypothetical protein